MKPDKAMAEAQLRDLIRRYEDSFAPDATFDVPPGWLLVLEWALESLAKSRRWVRIVRLEARDGRLCAVFAQNGDPRGERVIQTLLGDSRFYCPTCGKLFDV